jgi:hypothetical protein
MKTDNEEASTKAPSGISLAAKRRKNAPRANVIRRVPNAAWPAHNLSARGRRREFNGDMHKSGVRASAERARGRGVSHTSRRLLRVQ